MPSDHHYAPQFFLRNFAVDDERRKVTTVGKHGKHGSIAVWARRSIQSLGFEPDLYVHLNNGIPVSVEKAINRNVETPISKSETWAKISAGRTDALDRSDKPILYALIRHLEVRTPHYHGGMIELAEMADSQHGPISFSDEEREGFGDFRRDPNEAKVMSNTMSSTLAWTETSFRGSGLSILRSPIPLRSSTTPVMALRAPEHPALRMPLPGMMPYRLVLTLNRTTYASLVPADCDDAFSNTEIDVDAAMEFNRNFVAQFAHFPRVNHLITDRDGLIADMTWAPYDLIEETDRMVKFRRRDSPPTHQKPILLSRSGTGEPCP